MDAETLRRRPLHKNDFPDDAIDEEYEDGIDEEYQDDVDVDEIVAENESPGSSQIQQNLYPRLDEGEVRAAVLECQRRKNIYTPENKKRTKKNVKKKKEGHDDSRKYILYIFVLLFAFAVFYYFSSKQSTTAKEQRNTVDSIITELKQNFVSQSVLSMKVINASLRPVISEDANPRRPAVIVLTSSKSSSRVSECLAQKLAQSLNNGGSSNYVSINGKDYSEMNPDIGKEEIDKKLSDSFNNKELNVGVITELDEIPAGAAMIFHGYCDDTYAQFRKAVYIMTVTTTEHIPKDVRHKGMDEILLNRLREAWGKDLHNDQLASLLSRLTPSVAVVLPEDKYDC